ncbi:MAG: helix-turn-helix domain-containing protein [Clostridiales bacterium]|nr:helix-turn-helix domain-containing protein [Clostridiales bacterium]
MLDINYILQSLQKTILRQHIGNETIRDFKGIILLKNQSRLLENYMYVGRYSDGLRLLERVPDGSCITMFLSAEDVNQTVIPPCGASNIIVCTLDIFDLYNHINIMLQNYLHWSHSLREALCAGNDLSELLNLAAGMIRSQIYILNPGCKLIAASARRYFPDPLGAQLRDLGYLPYDSVHKLQEIRDTSPQTQGCSYATLGGVSYYLYDISHQSFPIATVLMAASPQITDIDFCHLLIDFSEAVSNLLIEEQEIVVSQNAVCASFIRDIAEGTLTESTEIQERVRALPFPMKPFYGFVLIRFDEDTTPQKPFGILIQQLDELFPETNITVYQNDIVVLHSQCERPVVRMNFDYDKLSLLLERFHAHAGIGNTTRDLIRMRTQYLLARETLRLGLSQIRAGSALRPRAMDDRLYAYEDYSIYYIIDLCARKYMEEHGHTDIVYLMHPSIIKLARYDVAHKTNLRDLLFYYLLCGCSLNRTASLMYMHRNTVMNKLNKINEIIGIPLDGGFVRHRLIISCLVYRYYSDYMHMTIQL